MATDAAPLVCIHGWGMNLRAFDPLREALRADAAPGRWICRAMVAVTGMTRARRWSLQLQDLQAVLPARCVLVGWSLGGQLALELARRAPRQVRRAGADRQHAALRAGARLAAGTGCGNHGCIRHLADAGLAPDPARFRAAAGARQSQCRSHAAAAGCCAASARSAARGGIARGTGDACRTRPARRSWRRSCSPRWSCPARTTASPRREAGAGWPNALPNARHVQIARAGHAPLLSHVDEVAAAIRGFMASCRGNRKAWRHEAADPLDAFQARAARSGACLWRGQPPL